MLRACPWTIILSIYLSISKSISFWREEPSPRRSSRTGLSVCLSVSLSLSNVTPELWRWSKLSCWITDWHYRSTDQNTWHLLDWNRHGRSWHIDQTRGTAMGTHHLKLTSMWRCEHRPLTTAAKPSIEEQTNTKTNKTYEGPVGQLTSEAPGKVQHKFDSTWLGSQPC